MVGLDDDMRKMLRDRIALHEKIDKALTHGGSTDDIVRVELTKNDLAILMVALEEIIL